MKIGICGLGFVGKAIYSFMQRDFDVIVYDKYKKINNLDLLLNTDIIYICVPTLYDQGLKTYNMDELDNTLSLLAEQNYAGIILIKSTVLPTYCESANQKYLNLKIIHNPEFLSASTAEQDFATQSHIILGYTAQSELCVHLIEYFYKKLFPLATLSINTSIVSALVKLACNSFYATKVQFFTEIYLLCDKLQIDFNDVKKLMLNNKWINPMHTNIPGSDGQISFGGTCLPKDISALNQYMIQNNTPNNVVDAVITERNLIRKD